MPKTSSHRSFIIVLGLLFLNCAGNASLAQELTPRAYWPAPTGTKVFGAAYQRSTGDIITDPSLPIVGVDSTMDFLSLTYQDTFDWFDRTTSLQVNLPYVSGHTEGTVEGQFVDRDIDAFADARIRLAVNIKGAPAMDGNEFRNLLANPETLVGVSLLVQPPTGAYQTDKILNAGTNRWSVKPALGVIWPINPSLLLEAELGVWLFGDNNDFLGGTRKQKPILSTEYHLVKILRPGIWASLDLNYYVGGKTTVDGIGNADLQRNSRLGATLAFPFGRQHLIRTSFSTGVVNETGTDFTVFSVAYLYAWQ